MARKQCLDLHVCVDERWQDQLTTFLKELEFIGSYKTDDELYRAIKKLLRRSEGWMGLLSWKSCREVDFVKVFRSVHQNHSYLILTDYSSYLPTQFIIAKSNTDKVSSTTIIYLPYSMAKYELSIPTRGQEEYLRMVAEQIVAGIANPTNGKGSKEITDLLPKKKIPRTLVRKIRKKSWGIRPRYGFAVWKFIIWFVIIQGIGYGFVPFWLWHINKEDLQNAFVPLAVLTTTVMIVLGLPQVMIK